jgi:outer membrane lipoprotein carrier protein
MRWDYLDPEYKVALVDGDETRLYLEEDRQFWEGRLDPAESLVPILLAGSRPLSEVFRPVRVSGPDRGSRKYVLRLVPLEGSESFEEVLLGLRPPQFGLEEIEVLDAAGNRVLYRFRDMKRNAGLPAGVFHFEPPPGTEILASFEGEPEP